MESDGYLILWLAMSVMGSLCSFWGPCIDFCLCCANCSFRCGWCPPWPASPSLFCSLFSDSDFKGLLQVFDPDLNPPFSIDSRGGSRSPRPLTAGSLLKCYCFCLLIVPRLCSISFIRLYIVSFVRTPFLYSYFQMLVDLTLQFWFYIFSCNFYCMDLDPPPSRSWPDCWH